MCRLDSLWLPVLFNTEKRVKYTSKLDLLVIFLRIHNNSNAISIQEALKKRGIMHLHSSYPEHCWTLNLLKHARHARLQILTCPLFRLRSTTTTQQQKAVGYHHIWAFVCWFRLFLWLDRLSIGIRITTSNFSSSRANSLPFWCWNMSVRRASHAGSWYTDSGTSLCGMFFFSLRLHMRKAS